MLLIVLARPAVSADEQSANPQADNATVRGATVRGATVRGATVRGATVRGYLDAGEFGPAMDLARGAPTAAQRDAWLGQIAVAQAGSVRRRSSLASAGEIGSDQARADTLSRAAEEPLGGRGGAGQADFDSLIDLITSTIRPTSREDVGGPGSIKPYPTGVIIDPQGVLRPLLKRESGNRLAALRRQRTRRRPARRRPAGVRAADDLAEPAGKGRPNCGSRPASPWTKRCSRSPVYSGSSISSSTRNRTTWCWPARPATGRPERKRFR